MEAFCGYPTTLVSLRKSAPTPPRGRHTLSVRIPYLSLYLSISSAALSPAPKQGLELVTSVDRSSTSIIALL